MRPRARTPTIEIPSLWNPLQALVAEMLNRQMK
jgi:hypothetical protein